MVTTVKETVQEKHGGWIRRMLRRLVVGLLADAMYLARRQRDEWEGRFCIEATDDGEGIVVPHYITKGQVENLYADNIKTMSDKIDAIYETLNLKYTHEPKAEKK